MRIERTAVFLLALAALTPGISQAQTGTDTTTTPEPPAVQTPAKKQPTRIPDPKRWEKDIAKFEAADKANPPEKGAVLFVGSSSIVKWKTLKTDFPDVPTLNRGFGGSITADTVYYVDRIVTPYQPRRIVFFSGDNDLAMGIRPQKVANDFATFVTKVRASLPDVPIVLISIKPSPSRWKLHDKQIETNRLLKEYCATQKDITFVDVYQAMLGADGQPRPELFVADKLHMSPAGYAIWKDLVGPYVK